MKIAVNLMVEIHGNIILRSHLLVGKTRACRCNIPKTNEKVTMENVALEVVDASYNLCEASRKELNRELERLKVWLDGRPTTL